MDHATDATGARYVVLSTGQELVAVPWGGTPFPVGRELRAHLQRVPDEDRQRQRTLAWQVEDLELARERDRGRGR